MSLPDAPLYDASYFEGPLEVWHRLSLPTFAAFLREAAEKEHPRRILDLGCGVGSYGQLLRNFGGEVIGCDGADSAVRRSLATGWYERVFCLDLEKASADQLGGPYDLIFTSEVIEHLADERRFCRLIADSLAPGGILVLTTTTYELYVFYYLVCAVPRQKGAYTAYVRGFFDHAAADRFVRTLWSLTGGHYHGFRARRLLSCLREAGLRIESWRYANVQPVFPVEALNETRNWPRPLRWTVPLLRYLGRALNAACRRTGVYGANILVAARKVGSE